MRNIDLRMQRFLQLFIFWLASTSLFGQQASIFRLMQCDSILDVTISLDWKELEKQKLEKAYVPAHLQFPSDSGKLISVDLKVRTRGHMRLSICSNPPLKLKFDKSDLNKYCLSPLNEIDLIQHCQQGEQYEQYILREYLAYKIYQELSPLSFNVQLVRIHYLNPDGSMAHESSIGYIMENGEEFVDRIGGKTIATPVMSQNSVDRSYFLKVCLFEYMIGNTDWFIKTRHNMEFVISPGFSLLVTVPYDFDYSGLVSAPYAVPYEGLPLTSVTTRYYQGRCESKVELMNVINDFIRKKDSILKLCYDIPGLNDRSIKHVTDYIEEFYTIIENPKKIDNLIMAHCDMWPVNQ